MLRRINAHRPVARQNQNLPVFLYLRHDHRHFLAVASPRHHLDPEFCGRRWRRPRGGQIPIKITVGICISPPHRHTATRKPELKCGRAIAKPPGPIIDVRTVRLPITTNK